MTAGGAATLRALLRTGRRYGPALPLDAPHRLLAAVEAAASEMSALAPMDVEAIPCAPASGVRLRAAEGCTEGEEWL